DSRPKGRAMRRRGGLETSTAGSPRRVGGSRLQVYVGLWSRVDLQPLGLHGNCGRVCDKVVAAAHAVVAGVKVVPEVKRNRTGSLEPGAFANIAANDEPVFVEV